MNQNKALTGAVPFVTTPASHNSPDKVVPPSQWKPGDTVSYTQQSYTTSAPSHKMVLNLLREGAPDLHVHGGRAALAHDEPYDLIIDLTGNTVSPPMTGTNLSAGLQAIASANSAVLRINWPDMHLPPLSPSTWQGVSSAILNDPAIESVYVCCTGGTGRTGTALAILGHCLGYFDEGEDPVAAVRTLYFEDAVETDAQVKYVEEVTGRTSVAHGSLIGNWGNWQSSVYGGAKPTYTPKSGAKKEDILHPLKDRIVSRAELLLPEQKPTENKIIIYDVYSNKDREVFQGGVLGLTWSALKATVEERCEILWQAFQLIENDPEITLQKDSLEPISINALWEELRACADMLEDGRDAEETVGA